MSDKEVKVRITGDISDLLNKLERVKDAFNDIGKDNINSKGVNNLIDDLQRVQDEVEFIEASLEEVIGTSNKLDNSNFSDMADEFSDANKQVNELNESFKELNNAINDIDTKTFDNLNDSIHEMADLDKYIESFNFDDITESIKESEKVLKDFYDVQEKVFDTENNGFVESMDTITELGHEAVDIYKEIAEQVEDINLNASLDSNNKDSNRFDAIKEGLVSGAIAGQTMKSSLSDVSDSLDKVSSAFKDLRGTGATLEEMVQSFHKLTPAIDATTDELAQLKKEEQSLKELYETFKNIPGSSDGSLNQISTSIEEYNKAIEENAERLKELRQVQDGCSNEFKMYANFYDALSAKVKEFVENEENGIFVREKVAKSFKEASDAMKDMYKFDDEGTNKYLNNLENDAISSIEKMEELREKIDRVKKEMKEYQDIKNEFGTFDTILEEQRKCVDEAEKLAKEMDKLYGEDWFDKGYSTKDSSMQNYIKDMEKLYDICKKINDLESSLNKANHAETELIPNLEHYNKQLEKEKETYQETKKEIDRLTKSYESLDKAVNKVSNNEADDLLDNISKKADEAAKSLSLVDFDVLKDGLGKLGNDIDDKAEKLIRFQQVNKELNDEMRKSVNNMEYSGKGIKSYADNAAYAVEVIKPLLEGTKLLSSEGFNIIGNDKSLEKQKQLFRDNIEVIEEYMRALKEAGSEISKSFFNDDGIFDADKFLKNIETFGKPLNELTMQMEKYRQQILENLKYEKENIESTRRMAEANKESAKAALDSAKAAVQQAEARKKNANEAERVARLELQYADSAEKSIQASQKLEKAIEESGKAYKDHEKALEDLSKAQKDYADASEKLNRVDKDRLEHGRELIEQYNKQAKALRQMGAEIDDIGKADVSGFDKSLGTLLDKLGAFGEGDIAKTFSAFKEDIMAVFESFNSFNLGDMADGLKDVFSGIFSAIPAEVKLVIAAITTLIVALDKLYESGKRTFFEGLSVAGEALSKVWDVARDLGQEIRDAFENITGMNLDLGSIIEQVVEFEGTITKAGVAAEASESDIKRLSDTARELGAKSRYSATEVATAMDELASAGWTVQDILDGIDGVVRLSEGSFISLGDAAEFVANGLTSLGMNAGQASDFVDIVSQAAIKTSTDVGQMQKAFTNAASTAGTLGVSATDLATALGLMANQGVKGAKAGTALKNLMANMASPTEKMTKCLEKYGLQAVQTDIVNGDLMGGVIRLKKAFDDSNLSVQKQVEIISTLAGKEALPGVAALLNNSTEKMNSLKFAIDSSTKSSRAYAESLGLVNEKGEMTCETFEEMIKVKGKEYEQWENFNKVLSESADYMTMVGGSTTDLGAIIHKLGADGEVTTEHIGSLVDVFGKMRESSKETTSVLEQYGIQVGRTEDGMFDFGETVKNLGTVWDTLTDSQKQQLITQLGVETSVEQLNELFSDEGDKIEDLIESYENMESVSEHLARTFDSTVKGALLNLASAMEEQCLQAFDSMKEGLLDAAKALTEFFNIWNGLSELEGVGSGFISALSYLSGEIKKQSEGWGKALSEGIQNAIKGLDTIINSTTFDNVLDIGTNIITGICDGIKQAKDNGSLDSAIDGAIKKICNWVQQNGPQIEEAGKIIIDSITEGIENNEDAISDAMNTICDIITSWTNSSGKLEAAAGLFAEQFVGLALEKMWTKAKNWLKEKLSAFGELFSGPGLFTGGASGLALNLWSNIMEGMFGKDPLQAAKDWLKQKLSNFHPIQWIKDLLFPVAYADSGDSGSSQIKPEQIIKIPTLEDIKSYIKGKIGNFDVKGFIKQLLVSGAGALGGVASTVIKVADLINIPTLGEIKEFITSKFSGFNIKEFIKTLLVGGASLGGSAGAIGGALLKAADLFGDWNPIEDIKGWLDEKIGDWGIVKWFKEKFGKDSNGEKIDIGSLLELDPEKLGAIETQLSSLSTMATTTATEVGTAFNNITNSARTEFVNLTNIVRNQFVNMTNIIRNQLLNCTNIVRNQALNMTNIVRNQALNMANIFRNQFVNMANIARNQFVNVANIIRNQMVNSANIVRNQCVNMANIFRNQFVSMANVARNQMVNVSNIIRNQAINWNNIIRNQITNARNTFTSQALSMAAVARTQFVNITNIVRNQATQWASVIKSQTAAMKSAFTSAFSGLSSIASSQMAKCLSVVKSYMSQIRAATAQQMTMNFSVNRTITTTNVTKSKTVPASASYAMRAVSASMFDLAAPVALASTSSNISGNGNSGIDIHGNTGGSISLDIPLYLDGREIAKATASYNKAELAKLEKRSKRKKGE